MDTSSVHSLLKNGEFTVTNREAMSKGDTFPFAEKNGPHYFWGLRF
jgi:hypothetical protein